MTVKWLMHWQPNPGSTLSSQIVSEVCQCVEGVRGVKEGRWRTTMTSYKAAVREPSPEYPRDLLVVALHERRERQYLVLRHHRIVVESDSSIPALFEKLQSYKPRMALTFEGFQYKLGDFQLKVGKCVPALSETLRGIVMEVEYLPLSSIEKSKQILEEFYDIWQEIVATKSLPGHFIHMEANFADYGLKDHYTSQHTAIQYATGVQQLIVTGRI